MLARSAIGRHAQRAACRSWRQQTRGLAEPASGSFQYDTDTVNGTKLAARDMPGPVTTLALVSQAGTRFQPFPGLAEALKFYAFKGTERRSTLRIQRESELLGSDLTAYHSRENLVIGARFLRDDLPYFVELLAEVASMTRYQQHVMHEEILPIMELSQKKYLGNTREMAINSAHGVAFHRGLGLPLYPASSTPMTKYLDADSLADYAAAAYAKPHFALVANGASQSDLSKWVKEIFGDVSSDPSYKLTSPQTKYYGGEERIAHGSGNSMVLAFPGSSSPTGGFYKPEVAVLAALLGGETTIKWSPGFSLLAKAAEEAQNLHISTHSRIYSDAGLFTVTMHGSASDIQKTAGKVVDAIKAVAHGVNKEDFSKAKALAKFRELDYGSETRAAMELTGNGLINKDRAYQIDSVAKNIDGVTEQQVQKVAKEALEHKASVSAVGDLHVLPYAAEIGLKV